MSALGLNGFTGKTSIRGDKGGTKYSTSGNFVIFQISVTYKITTTLKIKHGEP